MKWDSVKKYRPLAYYKPVRENDEEDIESDDDSDWDSDEEDQPEPFPNAHLQLKNDDIQQYVY